MGSRWEADVRCSKSLFQRPRPTLENSFLSLQKAEGQDCVQTPWSPSTGPSLLSCQLSPLLLLSCICLSFSYVPKGYVCSPSLCSISLLLSLFARLFVFMSSYSVSCSQMVSDSLGLWLALPLPGCFPRPVPYPPCLDKSANQLEPLG